MMSAIGAILVNSLSAVALLGLLVAVIDNRKRAQRLATDTAERSKVNESVLLNATRHWATLEQCEQ
jgi:hypothetical protein